jgi:hypothetical protein
MPVLFCGLEAGPTTVSGHPVHAWASHLTCHSARGSPDREVVEQLCPHILCDLSHFVPCFHAGSVAVDHETLALDRLAVMRPRFTHISRTTVNQLDRTRYLVPIRR